jgi:hypothetical protein
MAITRKPGRRSWPQINSRHAALRLYYVGAGSGTVAANLKGEPEAQL